MTIRIFFIDEQNSSKQNGIGTYRNTLIPLLCTDKDVELTLLSLNADCDNLEAYERDFGTELLIPRVAGGNWRDNGEIIWPLLRIYIADNSHNIFIFNHSPAAEFIAAMQEVFPLSKSIFVIHDQGWCAPLLGNYKLLAAIERGTIPSKLSKETAKRVHTYCEIERNIYEKVDAIVCLSESTERILKDVYKIDANKIVRIHNGYHINQSGYISKAAARIRLGLRLDDELLIYVARPAEYKGIIPLLKAFESLRKNRPQLRIALIGNAAGYIKYWGIGSRNASGIILPGTLTPQMLRIWYSAADIGVISSYTEQCSYVALEMMNAGFPIVASDGNGLRDMFSDGENSYVARIGNINQVSGYIKRLKEKILQALSASEKDKLQLKKAARRNLRTKYSASLMAKQYLNLIRDIISING